MSAPENDQPRVTLPPVGGEERRELERLREIDTEYKITLQVLAVVTERYLQATDQGQVIISDADLRSAPDFIAHRDDGRGRISLTVAR